MLNKDGYMFESFYRFLRENSHSDGRKWIPKQ